MSDTTNNKPGVKSKRSLGGRLITTGAIALGLGVGLIAKDENNPTPEKPSAGQAVVTRSTDVDTAGYAKAVPVISTIDDMAVPSLTGMIAAKISMGAPAFKAATETPEMIDRMKREPGFKTLVTKALDWDVQAALKEEATAVVPEMAIRTIDDPSLTGMIAAKLSMGAAAFKAATETPDMIDRMNREPKFKALVTKALNWDVEAAFKKEAIAPRQNPARQSPEERAEAKTGDRDRS